jgi:hypothetical protein
MRHHGSPGDFEKKLVHARPHAGALPGGDDDGRIHVAQSKVSNLKSKVETPALLNC